MGDQATGRLETWERKLLPLHSHIAGGRKRIVFGFSQDLAFPLFRAQTRKCRRSPRLAAGTHQEADPQEAEP